MKKLQLKKRQKKKTQKNQNLKLNQKTKKNLQK